MCSSPNDDKQNSQSFLIVNKHLKICLISVNVTQLNFLTISFNQQKSLKLQVETNGLDKNFNKLIIVFVKSFSILTIVHFSFTITPLRTTTHTHTHAHTHTRTHTHIQIMLYNTKDKGLNQIYNGNLLR